MSHSGVDYISRVFFTKIGTYFYLGIFIWYYEGQFQFAADNYIGASCIEVNFLAFVNVFNLFPFNESESIVFGENWHKVSDYKPIDLQICNESR